MWGVFAKRQTLPQLAGQIQNLRRGAGEKT
jgi:hypothetical protein